MNYAITQAITEASKVVIHKRNGTEETRQLSGHETVELIRKTVAEGGRFSVKGSWMATVDGKGISEKTTHIFEK